MCGSGGGGQFTTCQKGGGRFVAASLWQQIVAGSLQVAAVLKIPSKVLSTSPAGFFLTFEQLAQSEVSLLFSTLVSKKVM